MTLALLEREYEGVGSHINLHAGCTPSIALMDNGCHFVTRIDQIRYLEADRLPRRKPSPPELAYPFMAAIDTSEIQSRMARSIPLDVWVVHLERVRVSTRVERLKQFAHDLHVLLRHRLLLEAGGFEGFGLAPEGAPPDSLLIAPFDGQPHRPLNRSAATRTLPANASAYERPVSEVSHLIDLCPEIWENRERVSHQVRTPTCPR
jgi:hypothetical protein